MTTMKGPSSPRRILLATDLSWGGDRALDRAAYLAMHWDAKLVITNVLERPFQQDSSTWSGEIPRMTALAIQQVCQHLAGRGISFEICVDQGQPAEVVLRHGTRCGCAMIVTGAPRTASLGGFIFGTTVERLVRRSHVPILVVKGRGRRPYQKVMVATDFSETSRKALHHAADIFSGAMLTLLHCYRPIIGGLVDRADADWRYYAAKEAFGAFLTKVRPDILKEVNEAILIEGCSLEGTVNAYSADKGLDVLVVGTKHRSMVENLLMGSTAERLLKAAACDVLIVPSQAGTAGGSFPAGGH